MMREWKIEFIESRELLGDRANGIPSTRRRSTMAEMEVMSLAWPRHGNSRAEETRWPANAGQTTEKQRPSNGLRAACHETFALITRRGSLAT